MVFINVTITAIIILSASGGTTCMFDIASRSCSWIWHASGIFKLLEFCNW
jgi:hypothetical protein